MDACINFLYVGLFLYFLSSADFFLQIVFFSNFFFQGYRRVSNRLDPYQTQHSFRLEMGPNCLQSLAADDTKRLSIKEDVASGKVNS